MLCVEYIIKSVSKNDYFINLLVDELNIFFLYILKIKIVVYLHLHKSVQFFIF